MNKRKKYILDCLSCGETYEARTDYAPCQCGGTGELSVQNYSSSEYDGEEDIDLDNLVYDPNIFE